MSPELIFEFPLVESLGNRIIGRINAAREVSPILWSEAEKSWIVSGHAEVVEGFRISVPLSNNRHKLMAMMIPDDAERERVMPNTMRYFQHFLINLEGSDHIRLRKLMMKAFSRKVAESYRPFARQVIEETLDRLKGRTEVEFVEEVAREITARNLLRIMGLEDEAFYMPKLKYWAYIANAGLGGHASKDTIAKMDIAFGEMVDVFEKEIARRRANPGDDFLSMLITAEEDGTRLSDDELIGNMHLILIAGHDTTLNTMALSVDALSRDSGARSYMREHPEATLNSVMELMRFVAMSTEMTRIVAEDFEWKGHHLKAGQIVHLMIAGANRDPRIFVEPERLDLTRNQDANMAFAPGVHHCIGHFFAKMQLTEFFPVFLDRFDFRVLDEHLQFGGGLAFRGPQAMHLALTPR